MRSPPSFPELFPFRPLEAPCLQLHFPSPRSRSPSAALCRLQAKPIALAWRPRPSRPQPQPPLHLSAMAYSLSFKHTSHPDTLPHLGSSPPSGLASPVPTSDENPQRCHPGCEQRFRDGDKSLLGSEVASSGCTWDGLWDRTCWPATCLCPSCVRFLVNKVDPTFLVEIAGPFFYQRGDSSDCVLPS